MHPAASTIWTDHLQAKQAACRGSGPVTAAQRQQRLQSVIDLLVQQADPLVAAMGADFGGRPPVVSLANDVLGSLASLKYARDHLAGWMQDSPRNQTLPFPGSGASAWVKYQPKGVVGIIGTWNAPLFTLLSPLACALAAGNRAVLKPSEIAPRTAELLAELARQHLDATVVSVVTGGPDVAEAFTHQPWDHLVFTGSTSVGRRVMQAAAEHLVPVTLELGGKSPVIVGRSADIRNAAERIAVGKGMNAGQLCVSPDTVWVHASQLEPLVEALQAVYADLYPAPDQNPDVTPVVNERHFARVESYVADAAARGARVLMAGDWPSAAGMAQRRVPLRLVINPPAEAEISRQEIFGPAMVLRSFQSLDEPLDDITRGDHPLALYYFGEDAAEQQRVLDHTLSGGVSINDVTMHPALHDAPFGGVGASGMGHYHGHEGFLAFSHARTVYQAGPNDPRRAWGMLPPYSETFEQMLRAALTP